MGHEHASGASTPATVGRPTRVMVITVWALAVICLVAATVLMGPVRALDLPGVGGSLQVTDVARRLFSLVLVTLGTLMVLRGRSNRYGWLVLAAGATTSVFQAAGEYSLYARYAAAELEPPLSAAAGWVQDLWMVWFLLGILLLPALFPDGRTVGRWRRPVRLATAGWVLLIVVFALTERPLSDAFLEVSDPPANPTGVFPVPMAVINVSWLLLTAGSAIIAFGSVVSRWRTAQADTRQQMKWVLFAFGVAAAVVMASMVDTFLVEGLGVNLGVEWLLGAALSFAWVGIAVALGLGVLRYRLYDVDLVINRTLVYGVMTALVVGAYVAVVAGVATLLPRVDTVGLSLLVTGVVALAFAPVRERVQRGVNRLMFGRRDDPYAVLSELGRLLAWSGTPDATLATVVEGLASALKLPGVAIEVRHADAWQTRAAAGSLRERVEVLPLRHQGEVVGRMVVARRSPGEALHRDDRRLLEDAAHHAAALVHEVGLLVALQRSREQLVLAREEERRRLRRDLHDGLGPSLASQTFRLDAILEALDRDPAAAARVVRSLKEQNAHLVAEIRRLVYELRPPALDDLGLVGALAAHAGQLARASGLAVEVHTAPDPLARLPAAVEVAAYRIACEAVTNVVKHAHASTCTVTLRLVAGALVLTVSDDGVGVCAVTLPGVGLTSMRERAEELGGTLHLARGEVMGTRVTATLPMVASADASVVHGTARSGDGPVSGRSAEHSVGVHDG